jgi:ABC-type polysaccharide/polyol phosphate transport system ATPase subunit
VRGEGDRSEAEGAGAAPSRSRALGDDAVDASGRGSRQDPRWAVSVEGLWERFRIAGDRPPTLKERLFTFRRAEYRTFEALKDVSLRIRHGESVALIGHNGSGKSTLLKCIAGILPADEGSVRVDGRLATLLELGAGFHPDLSGRENVYLNGAILGLTRREVDRSFDAIVEFAGVAEFIDMPVRNYSSGMYVRLGFAIAVHVDPDILLVDEVLSVGDAAFQEKSLARMRGFGERGKTVVLVSHDLSSVRALCERTVVLDHGRVAFDGPTTEAIDYYEDLIAGRHPTPEAPTPTDAPRRTGDGNAGIADVRLLRDGRELPDAVPVVPSGAAVQLVVAFSAQEAVREAGSLSLGIAVRRPDMPLYVYETRTAWRGVYLAPPRAGATAAVTFTLDLPVLTGEYLVDLLLANASTGVIHDRWQEALRFSVASPEHEFGVAALDARIGVANPDGWWPPDLHAPPPERGGPRHHPLREDRPSPGYEPDVPRVDPLVSR